MDTLIKKNFEFDDGTQNPIFEITYEDLNCFVNRSAMSVSVRFVHFGGKYVYDYWNDVVHQPERFVPYGYIENNICKKFYSYYSNIDYAEAFRLELLINQIKDDVFVQHFHRKSNFMFIHLNDSTLFPIFKLVIPGLAQLNNSIMKKIRSENV
jgi:hypothetical protein